MRKIERIDKWRPALFAEIERCGAEPFSWGKNDCALFAANCVKAMTGFDPSRGHRGYRTPAGALRKIKAAGFETYVELAEAMFKKIHISRAGVGDLAIIDTGRGPLGMVAGVVTGTEIAVLRPDGLGFLPRGKAHHALLVGGD